MRRFWAPTRQALRFGFANFDEITVGAYLGHDAAMLVAGKFGAAVAALGIRRPSPKTAAALPDLWSVRVCWSGKSDTLTLQLMAWCLRPEQ